jgi:glycosyltransferase involved in cell wall biosynthesis
MKVIHLAPAATSSFGLTAHSFIDEEILGLRDAGVECLVASDDAVAGPSERHGVAIVRPSHPPDGADIARTIAFGARGVGLIAAAQVAHPRELLHAIRVEETIARIVQRERIDIIHSHFAWPAGLGGALASAATGVPLVASLRGMDLLTRPEIGYGLRRARWFDAGVKTLLRRATRTVYATEFMRAMGVEAGAPPTRAMLVRKGVDLQRFRPAADRGAAQRELELDGPVLMAVGTLGPRKGYRTIVSALAQVADRRWTFVACGDGPEREETMQLARANGLAGRVRFAGQLSRDAVARHFAACDIFLHAAVLEAAGNVVLEAAAAGCAAIVTSSGGPPEYVRDGETGLIVSPEDASALATALRQLLDDRECRDRFGRAARAYAEGELSYGRMIGDLIGVYGDARRERAARALPIRVDAKTYS